MDTIGALRKSSELGAAEMFDRQPILIGQLLQLRPLQAADCDALYRVAADPLIWAQHPDPSRAQPAGFKVFFDKVLESGGALVAIDRIAQQIIGTSRYHRATSDEVMIGYSRVLGRTVQRPDEAPDA